VPPIADIGEQPRIDPNLILIDTAARQRKQDLDISDIKSSIAKLGVIQPVVVRREGAEVHLIAGFRRTMACRELGVEVPVRYWDTLTPRQMRMVELEENIKRKNLHWRDEVMAYQDMHQMLTEEHTGDSWSVIRSAEELSVHETTLRRMLHIARAIDSPRIANATGTDQAWGILTRHADRVASSIVGDIIAAGNRTFEAMGAAPPPPAPPISIQTESPASASIDTEIPSIGNGSAIFGQPPSPQSNGLLPQANGDLGSVQLPAVISKPIPANQPPIHCADFLTWAPAYSGPKFNFIHCDFPYGVNTADSLIETYDNTSDIYWNLLNSFVANLDRLMSYSAHLLFWLSMRDDYFQPTKQKLRAAGLHVVDRPLIWLKSDMRGAAPGVKGTQPRHVYEAALLCSRGGRFLVKQGGDGYQAPSVSSPIHPTQKPQPMLEFFFTMLVDETTTMFDPTAGSGASLLAAEARGAKSVAGLELNREYADAANAAIMRSRAMRTASGGR
jgi:ParB/RepB/Spo0J family partition protein